MRGKLDSEDYVFCFGLKVLNLNRKGDREIRDKVEWKIFLVTLNNRENCSRLTYILTTE